MRRLAKDDVVANVFNSEVARALRELLFELADPLLMAGVTPKHFGEIAASAFVKAACRASTLRNGRVNQSRVAVLTGLSRPEVRKLMTSMPPVPSHVHPRTIRVLNGWTSDERYVNGKKQPRKLPITGARVSFASLVKNYAGDVPHRAVLEELRRMKKVRETNRRVELISTSANSSANLRKMLSFVLPVVSDSVGIVSSGVSADTVPAIYRLKLKALDARELVVARDRANTGARSFLDGLDRSLQSSARSLRKPKHSVTITVLVRERDIKKSKRRSTSD